MEIVHLAAELAPLAKIGGLGDVLLGLSRALQSKGHEVTVLLPKYSTLDLTQVHDLTIERTDLLTFFNGKWISNTVWKGKVRGLSVRLIEAHDFAKAFNRASIYGYDDDVLRFAYFSKTALEYLLKQQKKPSILHLHDWHVCLAFLYLREMHSACGLDKMKTVLTIHNLSYQGITNEETLQMAGFSTKEPNFSYYLDAESNKVNLLQGGIYLADAVTTVSPTYAKEVLHELGGKLAPVLRQCKDKFVGILNGIDTDYWNPKTDPFLPFHYDASSIQLEKPPFIEEKASIQSFLRKKFGLEEKKAPLVSAITRLVTQKGPHLIKCALMHTLDNGGQFLLLGTPSEEKIKEEFIQLKNAFKGSSQVHIELSLHEELAHLVYAASDLFVIPSLFEPCGLSQMFAMHYGTVPVARKTGGLADTVNEKNGFTFRPFTEDAMRETLDKAFYLYSEKPEEFLKLVRHGMHEDFSWDKQSEMYIALYQKVLEASSLPL